MRRMCWLIAVLTLAVAPALAEDAAATQATRFVEALTRQDFSAAEALFTDELKGLLPVDRLRDVWGKLVAQGGPFERQVGTRREAGPGDVVVVTCRFQRGDLDVRMALDGQQRIARLQFRPVATIDTWQAPAYVHPGTFTETPVTVGTPPLALPGMLAAPTGAGPFPGLVLVHGSGPNDRDETIGPNKVFRDLAQGLASQGIIVLRYDKRTKAHPTAPIPTVNEESVDDAVAAVALLQHTDRVDPKRVFVLGHSLGGTVLPRIAHRAPGVAGLISLAGAARSLLDAILSQFDYLSSLPGHNSEAEQKIIAGLRAQVLKAMDPKLAPDTPANELMGAPASYWLDLRDYHPAEDAATLNLPMLILQGGRDYQVTRLDYDLWQQALAGRANVQCRWYPDLNHAFITGQGMATPEEYGREGHVAEQVVRDIAGWIKGG